MIEHTHTTEVHEDSCGIRRVTLPADWPVGAVVTVTWTEPPEPTGRWVIVAKAFGDVPRWQDASGESYSLNRLADIDRDVRDRAEAALVDLIESDHLPPQMPSVDDIVRWIRGNHPIPRLDMRHHREFIRGTLDAIVALTQGRDDAATE